MGSDFRINHGTMTGCDAANRWTNLRGSSVASRFGRGASRFVAPRFEKPWFAADFREKNHQKLPETMIFIFLMFLP